MLLLVGHSLTAYFAAWQLVATNTPFVWWANITVPAAEGTPELALLPCSTLTLSHHGQKLWQQVAEQVPLLRTVPFADLATTPGRIIKLREEALLDAVAGQDVAYQEKAPHGVHPRLVMGARINQNAPQLVDDFATILKAALPQQPEARTWATADEFISQLPPDTPKVLIADDVLAEMLEVPLQPRRRHTLRWLLPSPLPAPEAPLLLLHRMPKGHTWLMLEDSALQVVYDGVADERQATRSLDAEPSIIAALMAHAQQLLPFFKASKPAAPQVTVFTDWLMPDGLPYLGPWLPPKWKEALEMRDITLLMAGGTGAREAIYAPALGEKLVELALTTEFIHVPLAPTATRQFQPIESLLFTEPQVAALDSLAHEAPHLVQSQHTQLTEEPDIKRMDEVRMVSKPEVTQRATIQGNLGKKPRIQTATVKST